MTAGVASGAGSLAYSRGSTKAGAGLPVVVALFIFALVTPLIFSIGPLRLSAYRVLLLLAFVPSVYILFSGKVGKVRVPDICVILICVWSSLSLIYHHGITETVEPIGIYWIEIVGAYLIGRCFVRTPAAFYQMAMLFFLITIVVMPFAVFEAVTGNNVILKFFESIGHSYVDVFKDRRLGLDRAQGPFAHPIHFGVFFGGLVGITYYVLGFGRQWIVRLTMMLVVALVGALALSSGPLAALVAQLYFIIWDLVLRPVRSRWYILMALSASAYVLIDLLSNRTPLVVFVSYLAFNSHTAYNRLLIWQWGTKNIFDNPVFGIGYNNWERLSWMTGSFDMFWLLPAMQHGVPVWILYNVLFFWIFIKVATIKIENPGMNAYRVGYLATMFGLFMSGWTVHYWDATFVYFLFLLSSGVWILDWDHSGGRDAGQKETTPGRTFKYSRFANKVSAVQTGSSTADESIASTRQSGQRGGIRRTQGGRGQQSFSRSQPNPRQDQ